MRAINGFVIVVGVPSIILSGGSILNVIKKLRRDNNEQY